MEFRCIVYFEVEPKEGKDASDIPYEAIDMFKRLNLNTASGKVIDINVGDHEDVTDRTESCSVCGGFAPLEGTPESPSGNCCYTCEGWFCDSCTDWEHTDSSPLCKKCYIENYSEE